MRHKSRQILNIKSSDYIFEIPLGKVKTGLTKEINIIWYLDGVLNISKGIIKHPPFKF